MRPSHRLSTALNGIICGVLGAAFGIVSGNALAWLIGGLLIGLALDRSSVLLFAHVGNAWLNRRRLLAVVLGEALFSLYVLLPMLAAYTAVHPTRAPVAMTPSELGFSAGSVSLTTADNVKIVGWYIPSQNGAAVILLHGQNANRTQVLDYARILAGHGYGVLLLDLRAHGDSGGDLFAPCLSGLDARAGATFLEGRGDVELGHIGAMGISTGAHVAICAAARSQNIKAVLADGLGAGKSEDLIQPMLPELRPFFLMAPVNWMFYRMADIFSNSTQEVAIKELVRQIPPRPIFFISAGKDMLEAPLSQRYLEYAGTGATRWVIPEANHCGGLAARPDEYSARMVTFFEQSLLAQKITKP